MTADEMFEERTSKIFLLFVDLEEHILRLGKALRPLNEFDKKMFKGIYKVFKALGKHHVKQAEEYKYYQDLVREQMIPDLEKLHLRLVGNELEEDLFYELTAIKKML